MTKLTDVNEIRRFSAELLEKERAGANERRETTPAELTEGLLDFCASLGAGEAGLIPVAADEHGLYGFCSDGVESKVKAQGGSPMFGWTIWEWPGAFWTAEFHAVWQSPDGLLSDITPKPGGEAAILFVLDRSYPPGFDFDKRPGNKRRCAYPDQDLPALANANLAALKPTQRSYEEARAQRAGMSLQAWMERKVPRDPLPALLDLFLAACDEHEDYFDTLGVSGNFIADHKMVLLNNSRVTLQRQLMPILKQRGLG